MMPSLRQAMLERLVTHRHPKGSLPLRSEPATEPCTWCAAFYGDILDRIEPLLDDEVSRAFAEGAAVAQGSLRRRT